MACNTSEVRVTRSTWCFEKVNNAHYKIEFEDPIPVGRPSLLYLQIDWEPDWKEGEVKLKFRKQNESSGGADVRFNDDNGSVERIFRGDISPQLITIYGKSATLGENADLMLDVTAHEEQQPPIPIMVRQEQRVGADEGITLLKQETTIAAMASSPAASDERRIWDYYNQLFEDARAFADILPTIENFPTTVDIPTIDGRIEQRQLDLQEIVTHLRTQEDRSGTAADKARTHTDAFDLFQGQWRGLWRQKNNCDYYAGVCQDHTWQQTQRSSEHNDIYHQEVVMGPDSRPYVEGNQAVCHNLEPRRDFEESAINTINIATGVITGAVGVNNEADDDGIRAKRPHIGFYIENGKLLWVAEEERGDDFIVYSIFLEIAETNATTHNILYTIMGFDFKWNRSQQQIQEINTKGGQYSLGGADRELVAAFTDHQLQAEHLEQLRFRRLLEGMTPQQVQTFIDNTSEETDAALRDYLDRLLEFVQAQTALRAAPEGERKNVVFIVGDPLVDDFYRGATAHFTLNPVANSSLVTNLRTLQEIKNYLANLANRPGNDLPWGEVSIVVHANQDGYMEILVQPGFPDHNATGTDDSDLHEAIQQELLDPLTDDLFDVRTTLRIRGCEIGNSQDMLHELSTAFGGDETQRPIVRAPKYLQNYEFSPHNWVPANGLQALVSTDEYLAYGYDIEYPDVVHGANGRISAVRKSNAQLLPLFTAKYPHENITLAEVAQAIAHPIPYTYTYNFQNFWVLPVAAQTRANRQQHEQMLAALVDDFSQWDNSWQLSSRIDPDGTIHLEYTDQTYSFNIYFNPGPDHTNAARRQLLIDQIGQHLVDQYKWTFQDDTVQNADGSRNRTITAYGGQTWVITSRPITEQDPDNPGQQRRVRPDVSDLQYFGEEVPARPAEQPLGENVIP